MRNIRAVFNQAISNKIISSELYPFGKGKYIPPSSRKAKKALPLGVIEKIYNYEPDNPKEAHAKDMWLFAYFANGLNVKDIAFLKYENIKGEILPFIRAKTEHSTKDDIKTIEVIITEDIQRAQAGKYKVKDTQIEKDYVLSWILYGISQNKLLSKILVFKGGTVLKKLISTSTGF